MTNFPRPHSVTRAQDDAIAALASDSLAVQAMRDQPTAPFTPRQLDEMTRQHALRWDALFGALPYEIAVPLWARALRSADTRWTALKAERARHDAEFTH